MMSSNGGRQPSGLVTRLPGQRVLVVRSGLVALLGVLGTWACGAPSGPRAAATDAPQVSDGHGSGRQAAPDQTQPAGPTRSEPDLGPGQLPSQARWRDHLTRELLPFWTQADALGTPPGNFPTFRCNDGTVYRGDAPCPELGDAFPWITQELGTEYTRMKSRQAFVYGVGFHLTGDERLLAHARAGVDYLRRHAYEPTGSAVSYWRDGQPGPPPGQRTTQDLAYAQLGLAFYYYLTRDAEVLADLIRLERHIFTAYYEPSWGMLRWVLEEGPGGRPDQQELVAQLDQVNAYLLLVAPLLEEPMRGRWLGDLHTLARVIRDRFFASEHGMFWGAVHDPARMQLGTHHTDFGHSGKALLMLYLTGVLVGDPPLVDFAREHARALLARAATPSGCWAANVSPDGQIERWSNWWTSAELDQAAATLALAEREFRPTGLGYLAQSYACWLERFVDTEGGEVWPFIAHPEETPAKAGADQGPQVHPPKVFHWKNGYHALEHALVAMITTAGLTGEPLVLYYAFREPLDGKRGQPGPVQPYVFRGTVAGDTPHPLRSMPGFRGRRVVFRDIH